MLNLLLLHISRPCMRNIWLYEPKFSAVDEFYKPGVLLMRRRPSRQSFQCLCANIITACIGVTSTLSARQWPMLVLLVLSFLTLWIKGVGYFRRYFSTLLEQSKQKFDSFISLLEASKLNVWTIDYCNVHYCLSFMSFVFVINILNIIYIPRQII